MRALVLAVVAAAGLLAAGTSSRAADNGPSGPVTQKQLEEAKSDAKVNGDTAWMLTSSGLVMLMVPGLALFYGGMVRRKNVLATMMQSMVALALIGVYWVVIGYCLAFGQSQGGFLGWSPGKLFCLAGVGPTELLPGTNIPVYVHVMFQGMFAIITPALISGAVAERIRFGPYCVFLILWATVVYCPLAHWVWAMNWWDSGPDAGTKMVGWLGGPVGAIDFAGGTVVHIAAGFSGLAAILVLRKRLGYPEHAIHPNSMVLTLTGAGLLWFGWFGFNGGSALGSGTLAGSAFSATQAAAAAAGLSWMLVEWWHRGKPTALGLASGIVAGLVAVTPASGFVYPWGGLLIGLIAGPVCYGAVLLKGSFKYDDSLDAFGVHGVGGFLGALLTGLLCYKAINPSGADGLFAGHGLGQFGSQLLAAAAAAAYAFVLTLVLVKGIDAVMGFTVTPQAEVQGLDRTEHGESGFDFSLAMEAAPERPVYEPRAATRPPDGQKRFTVVVEGADPTRLIETWSDLCQAGARPPAPEFRAVYPYVTTVQGNRFRFRGGNPEAMRESLQSLFKDRMGTATIQTHLENG